MGYLHIPNLYRPEGQRILAFRECFALEKIHGTSAHLRWTGDSAGAVGDGSLHFHSGGESRERFQALFGDLMEFSARCAAVNPTAVVEVYGEAYGGKQQGMRDTYGPDLKFIVFDVKIGGVWLAVPDAHAVATALGLEFVEYAKVPTDIETLDRLRDAPSVQAYRNGMGAKLSEGIVLRPIFEVTLSNGERVIAKHKRDDFRETQTIRRVKHGDPVVIADAQRIAEEYVTEMRLTHVLDKLPDATGPEATPRVIAAMIEDVEREASGEIVTGKDARRAIGSRAASMFKDRLKARLHG